MPVESAFEVIEVGLEFLALCYLKSDLCISSNTIYIINVLRGRNTFLFKIYIENKLQVANTGVRLYGQIFKKII